MTATRTRSRPRTEADGEVDARMAARRQQVQRRLRRRRSAGRLLVGLVVALVVAAALVARSPLASVRGVAIEGLAESRAAEVRAALPALEGVPLGEVDVELVRDRVEGLAWVASVDVQRELPPAVRVAVAPRVAVAALRADGGTWSVDAEGVVLAGGAAPGLPIVEADAASLAPLGEPCGAEVERAVAVAVALPADLGARLEHVEAHAADDVRVVLAVEGGTVEVLVGDGGDLDQKATAARLLLTRIPTLEVLGGALDVRAPSNPVLVPDGAGATDA